MADVRLMSTWEGKTPQRTKIMQLMKDMGIVTEKGQMLFSRVPDADHAVSDTAMLEQTTMSMLLASECLKTKDMLRYCRLHQHYVGLLGGQASENSDQVYNIGVVKREKMNPLAWTQVKKAERYGSC
jgi:hypothetical protein